MWQIRLAIFPYLAFISGIAPSYATAYSIYGSYTYTVPANTYEVTVVVAGGGGGGGGADATAGGAGGAGGQVTAILKVTPGQFITVNVGQGGATGWTSGNTSVFCSGNGPATSGYGGGGAGGAANCPNSTVGGYSGGGGSGGGASSVAVAGTVVVQAGGGGGGAGGTSGNAGLSGGAVSAATQTASCGVSAAGTAGVNSSGDGAGGGGGGGGYVGGAGGAAKTDTSGASASGGGAGSSCVSTNTLVASYASATGPSGAAGIAGGTLNSSSATSGTSGSVTVNVYTSVTSAKTSLVISDPINGTANPRAIPGATIQYCILFTNVGPSTAAPAQVSDPLPANVTFVAGSIGAGGSCSTTSTSLPSGVTASYSTGTLTAQQTTLAAGSSLAITFNATVN